MSMLKYAFLGIIQGLTEFFPVSSSGHLVIAQKAIGFQGNVVAVSVILHLGTCLALLVFFFKDILKLFWDMKSLFFVAVVTLITGAIGLGGKDFFEGLFSSVRSVQLALIVTGLILILTKRFENAKRADLNIKDALILGLTQGLAIIPGISRSGITISTLLFRKIDRDTAFKFSFLASIPAILGAALLEAKDIGSVFASGKIYLAVGFGCSFISGLFALWALKAILHNAKFHYFGYYCIITGVVTLLFLK